MISKVTGTLPARQLNSAGPLPLHSSLNYKKGMVSQRQEVKGATGEQEAVMTCPGK